MKDREGDSNEEEKRCLQIMTIGEDIERSALCIEKAPADKLIIISFRRHKAKVEKSVDSLKASLGIPVKAYFIEDDQPDMIIKILPDILAKESKNFDEVVLNIAGGEMGLTEKAVLAGLMNKLRIII